MNSCHSYRITACLSIALGIAILGCKDSTAPKAASIPQPPVASDKVVETGPLQVDVSPRSEAGNENGLDPLEDRPMPATHPVAARPVAARPEAVAPPSVQSEGNMAQSRDWPRFRGPDGNGASNATGLPLKWSGTQNIAWRTALPGPGSSSPIVFGDHVYLTCYNGYGLSIESPGDMADLKWQLVCLARNDGRILWTKTMSADAQVAPFNEPIAIGKHGYASSTPVADASGVYVFYGSTGVAAYSHDGQIKWHVSCGKQTHVYGSASSPILYQDLLIVHAEIESNSLIALDKTTGRERWRQPKTEGQGNTWSTPNVFEVGGRPELVFVSGYGKVAAVEPVSGTKRWEFDARINRINPTIIRGDGLYFALGGPNGKSVALDVRRNGNVPQIEIKWELNKSSYITSPVYHDGYLYWAHEGGSIAYCVNARTGEVVYQTRFDPISGEIYASPVIADGRIYYVSRDNGVFVISARPEFQLLTHNIIETDGGAFNGSPAISKGQILLRSDKFVYCIGEASQAEVNTLPPGTSDTTNRPSLGISESASSPGERPLTPPNAIDRVASAPRHRSDAAVPATYTPDDAGHSKLVVPLLNRHCLKCHGPNAQEAGFRVDEHLPNEFLTRSVVEKWSEVLNVLNAGEMPPKGEPAPTSESIARVTEWITRERLRGEEARKVTSIVMRRMNRAEYNNTVRDLLGIDMSPANDFPADPPAAGFDNLGSALTISPLHLEMYLKAAKDLLDRAIINDGARPPTIRWRFQLEEGNQGLDRYRVNMDGQRIIVNGGNSQFRNGLTVLRREKQWDGFAQVRDFKVPQAGYYAMRIRAAGVVPDEASTRRAGPGFHERRQQAQEQKLAGEAERRESRESFEKWVRPYVAAHFAEERSYRYGPPRAKLTAASGGAQWSLGEFDVDAPASKPRLYEVRTWLEPVTAGIQLRNVYHIPEHNYNFWFQEHDDFPRPELLIDWLEIEGPLYDDWPPKSHQRIFIGSRDQEGNEEDYARTVLANFMRRAYRRPLREGEVESKLAMFRQVRAQHQSLEEALKIPLMAVLCSPHFLYLVEPEVTANVAAKKLDEHQLATRLSYFLWSSMPDDELFALADQGRLANPEVLVAQADRMLADSRCQQFAKNFAGQWLGLRDLGANPPSEAIFTRYDDHLEASMRGESEAFFSETLHKDLNVLSFLRADFLTINERLARYYDLPGVKGDHFRVVKIPPDANRGGLVTQASILSLTSNGTRTSPVRRGVWILERLLGDPPPPPPPNAGDIPPGVPGQGKTTVRERLRLHREQPQCARCHNKIDPLGFALENFNAAGEWRDREAQGNSSQPGPNDPPIDAHARFPDGTEFLGIAGLQTELLKREDDFLRCLAEKMYVYSLGRELGLVDQPLLDAAVRDMQRSQTTLRSLIHHIVRSDQFRTK